MKKNGVLRDKLGRFKKNSKPWHTGLNFSGMSGKKHSKETIEKMRIARKKQIITEETKHKLRLCNLGKKQSKETIKKRVKKLIGQKRTPEQRKNMKPWNKGSPMSQEQKDKLSKYMKKHPVCYWKGKHRSEETKIKLRLARLKQKFPNKDTNIERILQKKLKKENIKFRTHVELTGQPDIFIKPNICIFCDGDYWHANPKKYTKTYLIKKNRNRIAGDIWKYDKKVNNDLKKKGYIVLRFWETDIYKNLNRIINKIKIYMEE
jgi:DNA mismatch endonuclease, patch repair protein